MRTNLCFMKEKGQRSAGTKETTCYDSDSELPHEWAVVRNLSEPPTEVKRLGGGGAGLRSFDLGK